MSKKAPIDQAFLTEADMARFFVKTTPQANGCLLWTAFLTKDGYGKFRFNGRKVSAHRLALTWATGEDIDLYFDVDHLCRARACVNPEHLEAVSHEENMLRSHTLTGATMRSVEATGTCRAGHDMSAPDAWLIWPSGRTCRLCNQARGRKRTRVLSKDPAYRERRRLEEQARRDRVRGKDA